MGAPGITELPEPVPALDEATVPVDEVDGAGVEVAPNADSCCLNGSLSLKRVNEASWLEDGVGRVSGSISSLNEPPCAPEAPSEPAPVGGTGVAVEPPAAAVEPPAAGAVLDVS